MDNEKTIKDLRNQIAVCRGIAAQLDRSRPASVVLTKLDEAALWADTISGEFGPKISTLE